MHPPDRSTPLHLQDAIGDRYALERELGRGGMGCVWLARDLRLDRPVAIKVLHPELAMRAPAREQFLREARTAASLSHPHIVPVLGVESRGDTTFLVMAMIDGETLGARVRRRGPLPGAEVERMVREIGSALGYAHARGVVHRDITPENVLVERESGRALLVDFGLAQLGEDGAGMVAGTPGYVAPEVIRGDPAASASDLYALGATAWFALTGAPPYVGESAGEVLAKHLVQALPDLPLAARGTSRRLSGALRACLEKDPGARPGNVTSLLAGLDAGPPPVAIPPALVEWFTRWDRIRVAYAIATPVLALQLLVLMEYYLGRGGGALRVAAMGSWALSTLLVPLAAHLMAELGALRRLAARGFGIGDIRAAWDHWTERLRQEHRRDGLPPLAARVLFDLTVVGTVVIAAGSVIALTLLPALVAPAELQWTQLALMSLGSWLFLGTAAGLSINLLAPGVRLHPDGLLRRLGRRFWRGTLAGLAARAVRARSARALAASSTVHRNTELVLGLAIDTLWKALPAEQREGRADVPAVAASLQHGAEELRAMLTRLVEARDALPGDDPEGERLDRVAATITQQHRAAVGQLETLRLQLLRAVALRTVTADLGDEIAAACDAERALLAGIAGAVEVRAALARPPRRSSVQHTPTPSPVLP